MVALGSSLQNSFIKVTKAYLEEGVRETDENKMEFESNLRCDLSGEVIKFFELVDCSR